MATLSTLQPHSQLTPDVLKHLQRLTRSFVWHGKRISYIHVYAKPNHGTSGEPLAFITAKESGFEGIACVDDAARAVLLACEAYRQLEAPAAQRLAPNRAAFLAYIPCPAG